MNLDNEETLVSVFQRVMENSKNISPSDYSFYTNLLSNSTEKDRQQLTLFQNNFLTENPESIVDFLEVANNLNFFSSKLAMRDPLTNLYNRTYLNEQLHLEIQRLERVNYQAEEAKKENDNYQMRSTDKSSLIAIDMRGFKEINDTYGHEAGDKALIETAKVLENTCQHAGDVVARIGGDEIVILLRETDIVGAVGVRNRINKAFNGKEGMEIDYHGQTIKVHISMGVGALNHNIGISESLKNADDYLYRVKKLQHKLSGTVSRDSVPKPVV